MTQDSRPSNGVAGAAGHGEHAEGRDEPAEGRTAAHMLDRVAALLDRPPIAFFDGAVTAAAHGPADPSETVELVRLFLAVHDRAERARCIDFVRALATPA